MPLDWTGGRRGARTTTVGHQSPELVIEGAGSDSPRLPRTIDSPAYCVHTRDLSRVFGQRAAVSALCLTVPDAAAYVLAGPNGSGKTTTFKMLLGLLRPSRGMVEVCGVAATANGRARANIGYVPESHESLYPWMRVRDLIAHHSRYFPSWDHDYQRYLEAELEVYADARFGTLSKGAARRVQILLALAHRPPLLLLDEPTDGLDPVAREATLRILSAHLAETRTTMLVATHLVHEMDAIADCIGIIQNGRMIAQIRRQSLEVLLRRYVFCTLPGVVPALRRGLLLQRTGSAQQHEWIVWGNDAEVLNDLHAGGAERVSIESVTLEQGVVALLRASIMTQPHP